MQRNENAPAAESSLIPPQDLDLALVTLADDADHPVDLSGLSFIPLILLIQASGNFHWGRDACVQANDFFTAQPETSLPWAGSPTLHVMRAAGAGTVTLRIKALGSK